MDEAAFDAFLTELRALQDKHGFYVRDEGAVGDFSPHLCSQADDELADILTMAKYWEYGLR